MQSSEFVGILEHLRAGHDLSDQQMQQAIAWFLSGQADHQQMRDFLVRLAEKGETVDELTGAAQALRHSMISLESSRRPIVDTCGTGGDGAKTFNISTAAALAIAATGIAVAKHGNRKITSSTGSADVLAELGIDLEATPKRVQQCLEEVGICFCFAPHFHPAMKHVGPVRREISHPTIFNRLGPLVNPAGADRQVLGVGAAQLQDAMAQALQRLGTRRSLVVRGEDGVDEISLSAKTRVLEVKPTSIREHVWSPADFGLQPAARDELYADDPTASAACIREVFDGAPGPKRDVVVMNAAAGLWIADAASDLRQCAQRVEEVLDSGKVKELVAALSSATRGQ